MQYNTQQNNWREILDRLSAIREQADYSSDNVDFVHAQLQSPDERIRGGACLAAEGCLFERYTLDLLIELVENDQNDAVRKAAIQSLGGVIYEGVMREFEDPEGADTDLEFYEEWDELQSESLQEDYRRVKSVLFSILQDEFEGRSVREAALISASDLGFLDAVQEWIYDFMEAEYQSSQLVAIHAMGKYPQFWIDKLAHYLEPAQPKPILMEAISSSYSSESKKLAKQIEKALDKDDSDILEYAILTLANINRSDNIGEILQKFTLHPDEKVKKAAKKGIEHVSKDNFRDYMENELGIEE